MNRRLILSALLPAVVLSGTFVSCFHRTTSCLVPWDYVDSVKIKEEFSEWSAHKIGEIHISVHSFELKHYEGIVSPIGLLSLTVSGKVVTNSAVGSRDEASRLIGFALQNTGKPNIFYDTKFYQWECESPPEVSVAQTSSFILTEREIENMPFVP